MIATPSNREIDYAGLSAVVYEAAKRAYEQGISVCPSVETGAKAPSPVSPDKPSRWEHLQRERAGLKEIRDWYKRGQRTGLGFVLGKVSGNLECLDFDDPETFDRYVEAANAMGVGDVVDRVRNGYCSSTPSRGHHLLWRSETVGGNAKLAMRPVPNGKRNELKTLIELKSEGGYVIEPPSAGSVHPTGRAYEMESGSIESIETITPDEREILLGMARSFDERPPADTGTGRPIPKPKPRPDGDDIRPGDDFDDRGTWEEALGGHFHPVHACGRKTFWRRAGKPDGHSATTGFGEGPDLLFVFSSSTELEMEKWYTKFQAYTRLHHGGDFKAAARALADRGYGTKRSARKSKASFGNPNSNNGPVPPSDDSRTCGRPIEHADFEWSEFGIRDRVTARFGSDIRYCGAFKKYLVFDGKRWEIDETGRAFDRIDWTIRIMAVEEAAMIPDPETKEAFVKWAKGCQKWAVVNNVAKLVSYGKGIPIKADQLDADPWLINCLNGTVDLRTGELRPHRKSDLITKLCPVEYDPDATAPRFEQFEREIFTGDEELIGYVRRTLGYSMTGLDTVQEINIFHGDGANGKNVLLDTFRKLLGDYACQAEPNLLLSTRNEKHPTGLADLHGKRFVSASETDDGRKFAVALVKSLTGDETLKARKMHQDFFEFPRTFKIFLATNFKPEITGTDYGTWRRIRLVPFRVKFVKQGIEIEPPAEGEPCLEYHEDPTLKDKLKAEASGIFNLMVRGCLEWQRDGMRPPQAVIAATEGYEKEMDRIREFIEDCCDTSENPAARKLLKSKPKDLYERYADWARENIVDPMPPRRFGGEMERRGFKLSKSNGECWRSGIRLKADDPDPG